MGYMVLGRVVHHQVNSKSFYELVPEKCLTFDLVDVRKWLFPFFLVCTSQCKNDGFGPILYLRNQWTEKNQISTMSHIYEKEMPDEKNLTFKGQEGHAEVK